MSIFDYLQKLLPNNETSNVIRSIKNMRTVIDKHTLPTAEALCEVMPSDWKFRDKNVANINTYFSKTLPKAIAFNYRNPNIVTCFTFSLQCMSSNLAMVESMVPEIFKSDSYSTTAMSYSKAALLQYVEACDFFLRYARCVLNYTSSVELSEITGVKETKGYGPSDWDLIDQRRYEIVSIASVVTLSANKTRDALRKTSDVLVTSSDEAAVSAVVGRQGLDPFNFSNLPFPISLIFRIRMNSMSTDVDDYEAAKAEAAAVEYRILLLKEHIENGYGDAVVERSLEVQEDRLLKLKRKIEKKEEEYGLD